MTAPALSYDPDMHIFFEKDTRDGISYIFNRYSKAKSRYLKSYGPKQESKHIYLDVNNLYRYVMSKFFPTSGFKWIHPKEFDLRKYTKNSSKRRVLEVDLAYPIELRELHYDYPLAPDKIETKREMLFDYQLNLLIYTIFLLETLKIRV